MVQSLHDSLCPITSGQEWGCGPLESTSQAAPPPYFRLCQVPKLPILPWSTVTGWLPACLLARAVHLRVGLRAPFCPLAPSQGS